MISRRTLYTCQRAAGLIALLALAAGCTTVDPAKPDPVPETTYDWPDTREQLMANFVQAYQEMDYEEYEACLHPDFRFVFIGGDIWERVQDLVSTENMFDGNQGHDEHGQVALSVQSIAVNRFDQLGDWTAQDATHPFFPNTDEGLYDVQLIFFLEGGEHTITITSGQLFYLAAEDVDDGEGGTRTRWFLAGQRDLDSKLRTNDDLNWGDIKALY